MKERKKERINIYIYIYIIFIKMGVMTTVALIIMSLTLNWPLVVL